MVAQPSKGAAALTARACPPRPSVERQHLYSVRPTGVHIQVYMAAKVFEGFSMFLNGLRASSLSPLDSSQNADHFAQNLSLRQIVSFKHALTH
eukprot:3926578-Heterocapsa_arctica.AAC.1